MSMVSSGRSSAAAPNVAPRPHVRFRDREGVYPDPVAPSRTDSERILGLDSLRATAMLLGIVLHAAIGYMPTRVPGLTWVVHNAESSTLADALFWSLHVFRMPVFFCLAGYLGGWQLARHGGVAYLQMRGRRLLLPLGLAMLTVLPITVVLWSLGWMISGRCLTSEVIRMKVDPALTTGLGIGHLWFVSQLAYLSAMLVFADWFWPKLRSRVPWLNVWKTPSRMWGCAGLTFISLATLFCLPEAVLGFESCVLPDPAKLMYYGSFFAAGVLLFRSSGRDVAQNKMWIVSLLAGSMLCGVAVVRLAKLAEVSFADQSITSQSLTALVVVAAAWLMVGGLLGGALRWRGTASPTWRYLSESSYTVYLVHLPLVGGCQLLLWNFSWPPIAKLAMVTLAAGLLSLAFYHVWVRSSWIGVVIDGRRRPVHLENFSWRWRSACVVLATAVVMAMVWRSVLFESNRHEVLRGQVWRSRQPSLGQLEDWTNANGLRSIVSLRRPHHGSSWFTPEEALCRRLQVEVHVVDLPENRLPTRAQLLELIEVLDAAPRPTLLQGRFGIARAGLAAAVTRLLAGQSPSAALTEFGLEHLSLDNDARNPRHVIEAYRAWLQQSGRAHEAGRFRHWAEQEYAPDSPSVAG